MTSGYMTAFESIAIPNCSAHTFNQRQGIANLTERSFSNNPRVPHDLLRFKTKTTLQLTKPVDNSFRAELQEWNTCRRDIPSSGNIIDLPLYSNLYQDTRNANYNNNQEKELEPKLWPLVATAIGNRFQPSVKDRFIFTCAPTRLPQPRNNRYVFSFSAAALVFTNASPY